MTAELDWPAYSGATPETRALIDAQHLRHRQGRADPSGERQTSGDDRLVALERRLAALEAVLGPGGQALLNVIAPAVGEVVAGLQKEIRDLATVAHRRDQTAASAMVKDLVTKELQEAGALTYCGIWRAPNSYPINAVVTHAGGLWLGVAGSTSVRPGHGSAGVWKLICKSGGAV